MVHVARRLQLGAAFLVPLTPLLALLVGPAWEKVVRRQEWGWAGRLAVFVLLALSVAVQWLGMLIPFTPVQEWLAAHYPPLFAPTTFLQPSLSPLFLQWGFVQPGQIQLAWWRGGTVDWSALLATVASALLGIVLLACSLRVTPERRAEERPRTIGSMAVFCVWWQSPCWPAMARGRMTATTLHWPGASARQSGRMMRFSFCSLVRTSNLPMSIMAICPPMG